MGGWRVAAFDPGVLNFGVCVMRTTTTCENGARDGDDELSDGTPAYTPFKLVVLDKFCIGKMKAPKTSDEQLVHNLLVWLRDHDDELFRDTDVVAIEMQKKVSFYGNCMANVTMTTLSHVVQAYVLMKHPNVRVAFQQAQSKGKVYLGNDDELAMTTAVAKGQTKAKKQPKSVYAQNKRRAIMQARAIMSETCNVRHLLETSKADDYADAFLHALYALQRQHGARLGTPATPVAKAKKPQRKRKRKQDEETGSSAAVVVTARRQTKLKPYS